jgi:hypothetical protein
VHLLHPAPQVFKKQIFKSESRSSVPELQVTCVTQNPATGIKPEGHEQIVS